MSPDQWTPTPGPESAQSAAKRSQEWEWLPLTTRWPSATSAPTPPRPPGSWSPAPAPEGLQEETGHPGRNQLPGFWVNPEACSPKTALLSCINYPGLGRCIGLLNQRRNLHKLWYMATPANVWGRFPHHIFHTRPQAHYSYDPEHGQSAPVLPGFPLPGNPLLRRSGSGDRKSV